MTLIEEKADSPLQPPTRLNAKLATLAGFVNSADVAPSQQAQEVYKELAGKIDAPTAPDGRPDGGRSRRLQSPSPRGGHRRHRRAAVTGVRIRWNHRDAEGAENTEESE